MCYVVISSLYTLRVTDRYGWMNRVFLVVDSCSYRSTLNLAEASGFIADTSKTAIGSNRKREICLVDLLLADGLTHSSPKKATARGLVMFQITVSGYVWTKDSFSQLTIENCMMTDSRVV